MTRRTRAAIEHVADHRKDRRRADHRERAARQRAGHGVDVGVARGVGGPEVVDTLASSCLRTRGR